MFEPEPSVRQRADGLIYLVIPAAVLVYSAAMKA
jgi:hypothetical protein